MNLKEIRIKICNNKNKVNSILYFFFITLNFAFTSIFPECIIKFDLFTRFLIFFIIPLCALFVSYLVINYILNIICYNTIKKQIKLNSNLEDQCFLYAGELKRKNLQDIKFELKEFLLKNHQFKFNNIDFEIDCILKYIKNASKIK